MLAAARSKKQPDDTDNQPAIQLLHFSAVSSHKVQGLNTYVATQRNTPDVLDEIHAMLCAQQHVLMLDGMYYTFANFSSDSLLSQTLASLTAFFSRKPTTMPGTQLGTFNCSNHRAHRTQTCCIAISTS
eukprot:19848-Heterococcus_DN1.PRE.2